LSFETGDACALRFAPGSFDASVSLLVFNFIPDARRALGEMRRVTKPGGHVAAAVWDYGGEMRMLRVFWNAVSALDPAAASSDESNMPLCRKGELGELWRQGGLGNVEERSLDVAMQFASFADYWDPFLAGQGPAGAYLRRQDEARRQALRAELKRRLALRVEGAPFPLPARAWAVRGSVPRQAPPAG
jgi:SAM-dependent methyltransferase